MELSNEVQDHIFDKFLEDVKPEIRVAPKDCQIGASDLLMRAQDDYIIYFTTSIDSSNLKQTSRRIHEGFKAAQRRLRGLSMKINCPRPHRDSSWERRYKLQFTLVKTIASKRSLGWLYDHVEKLDVAREDIFLDTNWWKVFCTFPIATQITIKLTKRFSVPMGCPAKRKTVMMNALETPYARSTAWFHSEHLDFIYISIAGMRGNRDFSLMYLTECINSLRDQTQSVRVTSIEVMKYKIEGCVLEFLGSEHNFEEVLEVLEKLSLAEVGPWEQARTRQPIIFHR